MYLFDEISTFAPLKSPKFLGLNVLSIDINSIISVEKIFKSIFLFEGLFDGSGSPFNVVILYRSPRPLTKIDPVPCCLEIPVVLVKAVATLLTPFLLNSSTPIF